MNATKLTSVMYRASSVLLLLFAAGHQYGFRRSDPTWNASAVVQAMQNTHFAADGFDRSYWHFFSGFGFFVTVLLIFSAILCWAFASNVTLLPRMMMVPWALAIAYAVIAVMTWQYFFIAPGVLTTLAALLLLIAAIGSSKIRVTDPIR